MKVYFIYIMASESGTLYLGVTNNLERRIYEHRNNLVDGFTKKYKCHKLVYFEKTSNIESAISRESKSRNGIEIKRKLDQNNESMLERLIW